MKRTNTLSIISVKTPLYYFLIPSTVMKQRINTCKRKNFGSYDTVDKV